MTNSTGEIRKWVIFGADDTLWNVKAIYDSARQEFCDELACLIDKTPDEIEDFQRKNATELREIFRDDGSRLARSFEDTARHFITDISDDMVRRMRGMADTVFYEKAEVYEGVEETVKALQDGGYRLGIITAGPEWVQRRRLNNFHLLSFFSAIQIVETKDQVKIEEFCKKSRVDIASSYFIGDSMDDEIIPAAKVGLKTILVRHDADSAAEALAVPPDIDCTVIDDIHDMFELLGLPVIDRFAALGEAPAFAIFEGGGAKGLALVGAMRLLEKRGFRLDRLAGTSAGAIVAGLVAAGYSAKQLYDPENPNQGKLDADFKEIFGSDVLSKFFKMRDEFGEKATALIDPETDASAKLFRWLQVGGFLRRNLEILEAVNNDCGVVSLDRFVEKYDGWLREKLIADGILSPDHKGPVGFRHLRKELVIISANVSHHALQVHSRMVDGNESVAEAVAASIAIPVIFQPRNIQEINQSAFHMDGGLLSNFPAWVFYSDLLRADPSEHFTPIFGVELHDVEDESAEIVKPGLLSLLAAAASTVISGRKSVEAKDIRRLLQIEVPVTLSAYKFTANDKDRLDTYKEGYKSAKAFFMSNLHAVSPVLMRPCLAEAQTVIMEHLKKILRRRTLHLRVYIMSRVPPEPPVDMPLAGPQLLEVLYHYNMDHDPDALIKYGPDETAIGACYRRRLIRLIELEWARGSRYRYDMTTVQHALFRKSLKALMCVPMFDPRCDRLDDDTPMIGVLCFDSDDHVFEELYERHARELAFRLARRISRIWCGLAKGENAPEPDPASVSSPESSPPQPPAVAGDTDAPYDDAEEWAMFQRVWAETGTDSVLGPSRIDWSARNPD